MLHSGARRSIQTIQDYWFPNLPHVPWPLEPITLVGILAREEVVFNLGAGVPIVLQSSRRGFIGKDKLSSRVYLRAHDRRPSNYSFDEIDSAGQSILQVHFIPVKEPNIQPIFQSGSLPGRQGLLSWGMAFPLRLELGSSPG
jgi:hypothetical protein